MKASLFLCLQITWISMVCAQALTVEHFKQAAPVTLSLKPAQVSLMGDHSLSKTFAPILPNAQLSANPYIFNPACLPFFCKIEYDMMKGKKLPFKFRLGDVEYVDEMENKRPAYKPQ